MGKKLEKIIVIDGKEYKLNIFVERRSSVRASLVNSGINIRLPRHLSVRRQNEEGKKLLDWAVDKIKNGGDKEYGPKEYSHGHELKVFGKDYRLDIEHRLSAKNFTKLKDGVIYFKIANHHTEETKQEYISKQLRKVLAREHLDDLIGHVNRLNNLHFEKDLGKVSFKYTTSRWGQCSIRSADINISSRLLLAPLPVLEYVIIHELAHLIHADHSRRFWAVVRSIDPYFKSKTLWLKQNGHTLTL